MGEGSIKCVNPAINLQLQSESNSIIQSIMDSLIEGPIYVVQDNIDTDQIIPAQYLNLVPTIPEEYEKLGSYALIGLPETLYPSRFIAPNKSKTDYPIIVAGKNFGCGSSREHAPIAMGASGVQAVVAESYARIFFRNCVATGELYPVEATTRLCNALKTGQRGVLNLEKNTLIVEGKMYPLKALGEVKPVIDEGGIFNFARKNGLIAAKSSN
jgi:3-isopropylmalate/(R)-2-methylmalate dehydratase small subunit